MSKKPTKRTFYEIKETLKDIMHIPKDYHLAQDMDINADTFRNSVRRNSVPYQKLLEYCLDRRIDVLSLLYKEPTNEQKS